MNEEQYFLRAINAGEPNADLIYADWLEEQGRSETDEIRFPPVFGLSEWVRSGSRNTMRVMKLFYRFIYQLRSSELRSESGSNSDFLSESKSGAGSGIRSESRSWSRYWVYSWSRSYSGSWSCSWPNSLSDFGYNHQEPPQ